MNILTEEELKERNRLLVLENDEQTAEIERLKTVLRDISTHVMDITVKDVYYDAYLEVKISAYKALEELK